MVTTRQRKLSSPVRLRLQLTQNMSQDTELGAGAALESAQAPSPTNPRTQSTEPGEPHAGGTATPAQETGPVRASRNRENNTVSAANAASRDKADEQTKEGVREANEQLDQATPRSRRSTQGSQAIGRPVGNSNQESRNLAGNTENQGDSAPIRTSQNEEAIGRPIGFNIRLGIRSFAHQVEFRSTRANDLGYPPTICGQDLDFSTWEDNSGFPRSWNAVIDRSEHNVHRISSKSIVHCHSHRQICTPIVKAVCDEIIGSKEWRDTAHGSYVIMDPLFFWWNAVGGNHRLTLSRSLHTYSVCQVIDIRHVMHMAYVDKLWNGEEVFVLTPPIMEKLLIPIQSLEAGNRGKTLADQFKLFEDDMLRCFPDEAVRKKPRTQSIAGRTTICFFEFFDAVWKKDVGGPGWVGRVKSRCSTTGLKPDTRRITGSTAKAIPESDMIRSQSILARCYNRNSTLHLAKDIYRGLIHLLDFKELHGTLHHFPLDPERTQVYLSGLGALKHNILSSFIKKVDRLSPAQRSESSLWETVTQRKSNMSGNNDDEEPKKRKYTRKSSTSTSSTNRINPTMFDSILCHVADDKKEEVNKTANAMVESIVNERIGHVEKEKDMYKKRAATSKTKMDRLKETIRKLKEENAELKEKLEQTEIEKQ